MYEFFLIRTKKTIILSDYQEVRRGLGLVLVLRLGLGLALGLQLGIGIGFRRNHSLCLVNIWNSLPEHGVNSTSVNSFKNNFWVSQEVYSNFKCDITGTGNRSLCQLE